jgi:Fe-S-cluster containining protein
MRAVPRPGRILKSQPLLARDGARFRCSGSGLCCTDIHGLGVLTRSEVTELRRRDPLAVVYNQELEGHCLRPVDSHCLFLEDQRCTIHAKHGHNAKPAGCRRFPYGLIRTPYGGRVTTEHRCPCRTLGDRPELSVADADKSLRDRRGRLEPDFDVPARIALRRDQRVSFDVYLQHETRLIARLNAGERAESVLSARPLPELTSSTWPTVAIEHIETRDNTSGGEAFAWFGDALLHLAAGHMPPPRPRPWHEGFERALAGGTPPDPEVTYNDWIADEIWMFRWLPFGPFDVARAELATRLAVARCVQNWIEQRGVAPGQAAAEAVMVCELAAEGSEWPRAAADIARKPSPADPLPLT